MRVLRSLSVLGLLVPGLLAVPLLVPTASASATPVPPVVQELSVAGVDATAAQDDGPSGVSGALTSGTGRRTVLLTEEQATAPFAVVGVTWTADPAVEAVASWVRTRTDGTWSTWRELGGIADEQPDAGTVDTASGRRDGTSPLWVDRADGVQVRLDVLSGADPRDLRISLVDPGHSAADAPSTTGSLATSSTGAPVIRSRAAWGADESIRKGSPSYASGIHAVTLHHTASSNDYSAEDVPRLLRGFYAYHVKSNGWSDLGYNLVVDRFGRIWEGRAGGTARPVIGSHAGGFNTGTVGISVIGTYESQAMSAEAREAVAQLAGWRLGLAGKDPDSTVRVYSAGSTRYPKGTLVTLPRVFGHRDVSTTACPGVQGMAALPGIRTRAAALAAGTAPAPVAEPAPVAPTPVAASPGGLQVVAPTNVAAGSTVGITVKGGAGGAAVEVWFSRRGDPTFSRRREANLALDGTFRTSYIANDEYTFFAVSGATTSPRATTRIDVLPPLLVAAAPRVAVTAPPAVDAGSGVPVVVTGTPGAAVDLWFRKRGSLVWSRLRQGSFDAAGRWWTTYVGADDHDYWASSGGLTSKDTTTLAMPVLKGPRSASFGSRVDLAGRARPGDQVVVESRRRGAAEFVRTTLTADGSGVFGTFYAADDEYEYRPVAGSRIGTLGRTTVSPTVSGLAAAMRNATVTLSGTARPGSVVEVLFRRDEGRSLLVGGRRARNLPTFRVGRVVTAGLDGRWSTTFAPAVQHSWYARSDGNATPIRVTTVR